MIRFVPPPMDDRPKEVRGQQVTVVFSVDATGRVTHVEFRPEIRDRGYRKRLLESMESYRWLPARGPDGFPVAAITEIKIEL
jgi:hypothetical protein